LFSGSGAYGWDKTLIMGKDAIKRGRVMDQSRIGDVLTGNPKDLQGGPPVKALFVQNTNPATVAPDQAKVRAGFEREDLFAVVHEQFMTDTARYADIVLPATMFLEHDDVYQASGHQSILFGRKLVEAPGECRSNHEVLSEIAKRVEAEHRGFKMSPREIIDETLNASKRRGLDELDRENWFYTQPDFDTSHFVRGFGHPDGKFRFKPNWKEAGQSMSPMGALGDIKGMPQFPDFWDARESVDEATPFRLATSPSRTYLNSSFTETPGSQRREGRPTLLVHPDDLADVGLTDGDKIVIGNVRGQVFLHAKANEGQQRGTLIAEGIWPNSAYENGCGVNTLVGSDQPAPAGGGAFHDSAVFLKSAPT
jgi:anaerobic selenocysteine-containing dehydrogenase